MILESYPIWFVGFDILNEMNQHELIQKSIGNETIDLRWEDFQTWKVNSLEFKGLINFIRRLNKF